MMSFCRRAVLLGCAAVTVGLVLPAPVVGALQLPFTDTNAQGYIGLCNPQGREITTGSTLTVPFAWKAISSVPAPSGYAKGKATLFAFQPRPQVDPGDWSGEPLTGSSTFSNPAHPLVQATNLDAPLISFVGAYPPEEEGLVELRMYFSGIDKEEYSDPYPATVLQVTGTTWKVVSGGTVSCSSGTGVSGETQVLGPAIVSRHVTAQTVPDPGGVAPSTTTPGGGSGTTPGGAGSTTTAPGAATGAAGATTTTTGGGTSGSSSSSGGGKEAGAGLHRAAATSSGGVSTGLVALIAIGVAVVAGVGGFGLSRSRFARKNSTR
jgi:hypothetical protein